MDRRQPERLKLPEDKTPQEQRMMMLARQEARTERLAGALYALCERAFEAPGNSAHFRDVCRHKGDLVGLAQAAAWLVIEDALLDDRRANEYLPSLRSLAERERGALLADLQRARRERLLDLAPALVGPLWLRRVRAFVSRRAQLSDALARGTYGLSLHALAAWLRHGEAVAELSVLLYHLMGTAGVGAAARPLPQSLCDYHLTLLWRARQVSSGRVPKSSRFPAQDVLVPGPPPVASELPTVPWHENSELPLGALAPRASTHGRQQPRVRAAPRVPRKQWAWLALGVLLLVGALLARFCR